MARTGESWNPVFNRRERDFPVRWVQAAPITAVPGRVQVPQRLVWTERWCQLDHRDETMARCDAPLEADGAPDAEAGI